MNRDEIIRMAQEAGLLLGYPFTWGHLERFAVLVAAAERDACAKVCKEHFYAYQAYDVIRARGQE